MLVLSRREGEKINIGDSIVVTVVRSGADKVRIGIEAPDHLLILRGELEVLADGPRTPKQDTLTRPCASQPAA